MATLSQNYTILIWERGSGAILFKENASGGDDDYDELLSGDDDWSLATRIPPLYLAEGIYHNQNLDIILQGSASNTSEKDGNSSVIDIFIVNIILAVAHFDHASSYKYELFVKKDAPQQPQQNEWEQLGPNFKEFNTPVEADFPDGSIGVELAIRDFYIGGERNENDNSSYKPNILVLAIAALNKTDGTTKTSVYEYYEDNGRTDAFPWKLVGNETIPCFDCGGSYYISISLGDGGTMIAIAHVASSGRVRVFGRDDVHYSCNGDDDAASTTNTKFWCQLGNELGGGDHEDLYCLSLQLTTFGSRLVDPQCLSEFCSQFIV